MSLARLGTMLTLAALLGGCDAGEPRELVDGGLSAFDASLPDTGVGPPAPEGDLQCFDEADNDDNGLVDCEESGCAASPLCCVGSARGDCCAIEPETLELSLGSCEDGPAADCLGADARYRLFGSVLPAIEDSALVPQGGATYGGVALAAPFDLRAANVTFAADVVVPAAASRCSDCADAAGVAILDALPEPGAPVAVRFGVLAVASRDEVVVIAADEVVARAALVEGSSNVEIELHVDGTAVARATGADLDTEIARIEGLDVPESAWLAVLGQTTNRAGGVEAVRVTGATATSHRCDVPAAIVRRSAPVVPWSAAVGWSPRAVSQPSVAVWDESGARRAMMAFAHEGSIYLARRTAAGEFRNQAGDPGPPAFALPDGVVSARDPSLLVEGTAFVVYFVGLDASGASRVYKITGEVGWLESFPTVAEPVLDPKAIGLEGIDGVAVAHDESGWTMVARADTGQDRRLVRFTSDDGLLWTFHGGALAAATLRLPRTGDLFAFDRDEVAAPALVRLPDARGRDVTRVYYAGRRGTRWSIGVLASLDRATFRPVGQVLAPGSGFDALGVLDPAPVVEDGVLRLYYAGTDGATTRIGLAGPAGTLGE